MLTTSRIRCVLAVFLVCGLADIAPAMAQLCTAGTYSSTGNSPCTQAGPGYYVPTTGATSETPAPLGSFVASSGAFAPTQATPGYFVPTTAATGETAAPRGSFVAGFGASAPTQASPGYFVSTIAASSATPAVAGMYVPGAGAFDAYSAGTGHYVPVQASATETQTPAGFYNAVTGSRAAQPDPAGTFSVGGAATALNCPAGIICSGGVLGSPNRVVEAALGATPVSLAGLQVSLGQAGVDALILDNPLFGISGTATPQSFTLTSIALTGDPAFSLINQPNGFVLGAGGSLDIGVLFDPIGYGSFTSTLLIDTSGGPSMTVQLSGSVVPEPPALAMLLPGLLALLTLRRKRAGARAA